MNRNRRKKGFTLIEIMIVVLIIGVLMAIAVPNFLKARGSSRYQTIKANLKQIDAAKSQWAMEKGKSDTDAVTSTDLDPNYVKWPTGPLASGTYSTGGTVSAASSYNSMTGDQWDAACGPAATGTCPL